jgi:hypothetical protein
MMNIFSVKSQWQIALQNHNMRGATRILMEFLVSPIDSRDIPAAKKVIMQMASNRRPAGYLDGLDLVAGNIEQINQAFRSLNEAFDLVRMPDRGVYNDKFYTKHFCEEILKVVDTYRDEADKVRDLVPSEIKAEYLERWVKMIEKAKRQLGSWFKYIIKSWCFAADKDDNGEKPWAFEMDVHEFVYYLSACRDHGLTDTIKYVANALIKFQPNHTNWSDEDDVVNCVMEECKSFFDDNYLKDNLSADLFSENGFLVQEE